MKYYALRWKIFVVLVLYFLISPILHGIYDGTPAVNILSASGISIAYVLLGWILIGMLLTRRYASVAVSAAIWLFPLIVLAIFVLKYNYQYGGTPSILYVSVALLQFEFKNNPQLKSYLRHEWSWLSMALAVMLFLDLIVMYAIRNRLVFN